MAGRRRIALGQGLLAIRAGGSLSSASLPMPGGMMHRPISRQGVGHLSDPLFSLQGAPGCQEHAAAPCTAKGSRLQPQTSLCLSKPDPSSVQGPTGPASASWGLPKQQRIPRLCPSRDKPRVESLCFMQNGFSSDDEKVPGPA